MFEKQITFKHIVHEVKQDTFIMSETILEDCYYECDESMDLEDCEEIMFKTLCEEMLYMYDDVWIEDEKEVRSIIREYLKIHHHCE